MLNARLSELERLLAKSNVSPSKAKTADLNSVDEYSSMKEENRVVRVRGVGESFVGQAILTQSNFCLLAVNGSDGRFTASGRRI
jgi:hypothetical protein